MDSPKSDFGRQIHLAEKASRDMGYRSDSIAISRDMGPLGSTRIPILTSKTCQSVGPSSSIPENATCR